MKSDTPDIAPYVFVSYSSRDRECAVGVADALERCGISVWFDRRSIAAGSNWDAEIVRGVRGAAAVVLLASEASVTSPNVQQELRLAWEEQRPIVPLLLERAAYPDAMRYILAGRQWVELLGATIESCLSALMDGLAAVEVFPAQPPPSSLPTTLTSFIGRERELSDAGRLLAGNRLVTLTGAGGTGKTRLALELAKRGLYRHAGGVFFVDLSALMVPDGIASSVGAVLGLREEPLGDMVAAICEFVGESAVLLVIDNCEHLIEACAAAVATLLKSCPNLQILATSREALVLPGEVLFGVPALSLPAQANELTVAEALGSEAVRLFVERAKLGAPTFDLTATTTPAVAEICRRLDGVPLALELAAARVRSMSAAEIAERLNDRFRLLTGGDRSALPRQRTLRAAIDWSYDLLDPAERAVLQRLSVFVGGSSLKAAETVCRSELVAAESILEAVTHLVERSLVVFQEGAAPRYRLLETIREYGLEKLSESGELDAAKDAHLGWVVQLAEDAAPEFWGNDSIGAHERVERDYDNVRVAIEWARAKADPPAALMRITGSLAWFWLVRGHGFEGAAWAEEAVARSSNDASEARMIALDGAGWLASLGDDGARGLSARQTEQTSAESLFSAALELALQAKDERRVVAALWGLGNVHGMAGDYERGRGTLEDALARNRVIAGQNTEQRWREVVLLNSLGNIAEINGPLTESEHYYQRAVDAARSYGLRAVRAAPLGNLAQRALARGESGIAGGLFAEALGIWREMGASGMFGGSLLGLARAALDAKDLPAAVGHLEEALKVEQKSGATLLIPHLVAVLAEALLVQGWSAAGAQALGAAEAHQFEPDERDRAAQDADRRDLVAVLGEGPFEREYAVGQGMRSDQLVPFLERQLQHLSEEAAN